MRSYKFTLYVWYDEKSDGMLETDSIRTENISFHIHGFKITLKDKK